MHAAISILTPDQWLVAVLGALIAGLVKGVVGFALPMVMISILGSVVSPELALAGLILPTLVTNSSNRPCARCKCRMEQYREVPYLYVNSVDCVAHQCAIDPRNSKRPFSWGNWRDGDRFFTAAAIRSSHSS